VAIHLSIIIHDGTGGQTQIRKKENWWENRFNFLCDIFYTLLKKIKIRNLRFIFLNSGWPKCRPIENLLLVGWLHAYIFSQLDRLNRL
jgi:hypothetical protein